MTDAYLVEPYNILFEILEVVKIKVMAGVYAQAEFFCLFCSRHILGNDLSPVACRILFRIPFGV